MIKLLIAAFFSLQLALADTFISPMATLNYNVPDTNALDNVESEDSAGGWGVGVRALMGVNDQLFFRSGAGFVQKNFSYKTDGGGLKGEQDFQYSYLNIPLTLYWKASPTAGFFFGTALNAKMDDSCDGTGDFNNCDAKKTKSLVFPAIIGFEFGITKKIGVEISYEHALTETAKDLKVNTTVVSILYHFDSI